MSVLCLFRDPPKKRFQFSSQFSFMRPNKQTNQAQFQSLPKSVSGRSPQHRKNSIITPWVEKQK